MSELVNALSPIGSNSQVSSLAINLLVYGTAEDEQVVGDLLSQASPYDLGLTIQAWYQMALGFRGNETVEKAGRKTAQFFQEQIESDEPSQEQKVAASFARSLMLDLIAGLDDRYAELWASVMDHHAETVPHIGALFLGWTIGILGPGSDEVEQKESALP